MDDVSKRRETIKLIVEKWGRRKDEHVRYSDCLLERAQMFKEGWFCLGSV